MKHLKEYKIFESMNLKSNESIVQDLEDICAELEDIGFTINLSTYSVMNIEYVKVTILFNPRSFSWGAGSGQAFYFTKDVHEVILRVYQYMREIGWYSKLTINNTVALSKKFYIKADDRIRTEDIIYVSENWPRVYDIEMEFNRTIKT